ncbi:hypothetical protein D3C74_397000 [compost metagenome]
MKEYLPQSELVRDMIALPTPCGNIVYYPAKLAIMGTQGKYSLFHTIAHESGTSYLCTTQPDRVRIRAAGKTDDIVNMYESATWHEFKLQDGNGTFFYKVAPSLNELNDYAYNLSTN